MLYKGLLATSLSGSLDGLVASHNRGGPYFRNRVVPTDPASTRQVNCRSAMAQCYADWYSGLDADIRARWDNFAKGNRVTNRIGDPRTLSGFDAYCRQAYNWNHAQLEIPPEFDPQFTPPSEPPTRASLLPVCPPIVLSNDNTFVQIALGDTEPWLETTDCALLFYVGRVTTNTVNFYRGPYKLYAGVIGDDETSPPPSWEINITPYIPVNGDRVWWKLRFLDKFADLQAAWHGYFDRVIP